MKTLGELQAECRELGLTPDANGRPSKEPWIAALREFYWNRDHPGRTIPPQIQPMLLADWKDLAPHEAADLEADQHAWIIQPKLDGVRVLLHVNEDGVRITGRCISETTYRLTEHQDNLMHLTAGFNGLNGTVLDGDLVCPAATVDTGSTVTANPLQAAVAVLATSPENAARIQQDDAVKLRLHVFDILTHAGRDVTLLPLWARLGLLVRVFDKIANPQVAIVPGHAVNKPAIHNRLLEQGGEGTVWKRADQKYEPGRRVKHWIKRKRECRIEAFVSGFKLGSPTRGHAQLVGAVEFSVSEADGTSKPIAWVCGWKDAERQAMTETDESGAVKLNPAYFGRKAILTGHDVAERAGRMRHARFEKWLSAANGQSGETSSGVVRQGFSGRRCRH